MLINNKPVRFIHIPKNAGTSINEFSNRNKIDLLFGELKGSNHRPAYSWIREDSFKFCTVRNPYSRMVSYYKFAKRKAKEVENNQWDYSFEKMVKEKIHHMSIPIPSPWIPQVWWMFEHTSPFKKSKSMFGSIEDQVSLKFVNLDKCMIDKIFKLENTNFDNEVKEFLKCDNNFIKENISPGDDDEVYYTPELKEIVYERLKVDFDILGYNK